LHWYGIKKNIVTQKKLKMVNSKRTCLIALRLTAEEYAKVTDQYQSSTCRSLCHYVRKHLFDKTLTICHRDQSLEDCIEELALLHHTLHGIASHRIQISEKIDSQAHIGLCKTLLVDYHNEEKKLLSTLEAINENIQKMTYKWLQS
jgi:hypothetical protein